MSSWITALRFTRADLVCSGAWLVGSTWMIFEMGAQILEGLEIASEHTKHQ